jgi:hypothetical protein
MTSLESRGHGAYEHNFRRRSLLGRHGERPSSVVNGRLMAYDWVRASGALLSLGRARRALMLPDGDYPVCIRALQCFVTVTFRRAMTASVSVISATHHDAAVAMSDVRECIQMTAGCWTD